MAVFGLAGHTCMPAHTEGAANAASPHNGIQEHTQTRALITSFTSMTRVSYRADIAMSTFQDATCTRPSHLRLKLRSAAPWGISDIIGTSEKTHELRGSPEGENPPLVGAWGYPPDYFPSHSPYSWIKGESRGGRSPAGGGLGVSPRLFPLPLSLLMD